MNNKHNESYESRGKNASHDQSLHSAFVGAEKRKFNDKNDESDPSVRLKRTFDAAKKLLIDGQPQQAIEDCMNALKEASEVFGENSVESLPGYFILAEANIEEGKYEKAEKFLIHVYWNLFKQSPDEKQAAGNNSNINKNEPVLDEKEYMAYKGVLHKVFAKLYSAKRDFDRALDELKNAIYIDSCHYGPENIQTTIGYFSFGEVLLKFRPAEQGYSFYNQGVKIWYKFFKNMIRNEDSEANQVDDILIKQGLSQLKRVEDAFLDRLKTEGQEEVIEDLYRLNYALAFLHRYMGEEDVALEYCRNIDGYLSGRYQPNHPKLNRFHEFFPNYQDNVPQEEDEEGIFDDENGEEYSDREENNRRGDYREGDEEDSENEPTPDENQQSEVQNTEENPTEENEGNYQEEQEPANEDEPQQETEENNQENEAEQQGEAEQQEGEVEQQEGEVENQGNEGEGEVNQSVENQQVASEKAEEEQNASAEKNAENSVEQNNEEERPQSHKSSHHEKSGDLSKSQASVKSGN